MMIKFHGWLSITLLESTIKIYQVDLPEVPNLLHTSFKVWIYQRNVWEVLPWKSLILFELKCPLIELLFKFWYAHLYCVRLHETYHLSIGKFLTYLTSFKFDDKILFPNKIILDNIVKCRYLYGCIDFGDLFKFMEAPNQELNFTVLR